MRCVCALADPAPLYIYGPDHDAQVCRRACYLSHLRPDCADQRATWQALRTSPEISFDASLQWQARWSVHDIGIFAVHVAGAWIQFPAKSRKQGDKSSYFAAFARADCNRANGGTTRTGPVWSRIWNSALSMVRSQSSADDPFLSVVRARIEIDRGRGQAKTNCALRGKSQGGQHVRKNRRGWL